MIFAHTGHEESMAVIIEGNISVPFIRFRKMFWSESWPATENVALCRGLSLVGFYENQDNCEVDMLCNLMLTFIETDQSQYGDG